MEAHQTQGKEHRRHRLFGQIALRHRQFQRQGERSKPTGGGTQEPGEESDNRHGENLEREDAVIEDGVPSALCEDGDDEVEVACVCSYAAQEQRQAPLREEVQLPPQGFD